ncbi:MAG: cysteine--tRNA ligase [Oscillospiraceae bacterium]
MKIYNTLTKEKDELKTIEEGKVKIYACGPTVYNFIHIGNARPICVFDTLRRYLTYKGFEVEFVQNFTDVDDKIIKKANEEGVLSTEISERYILEYQKDATGLNVLEATIHPKVTENMDEIIAFVKTLVDKGFAYEAQGDVYFRTAKFDEYGKLSHMPLEDLEAGARIDVNSIKENPVDFALWKSAKEGEPSWKSPWGEGRPGWHIECSAMVKKYLGETIDIHCGGQDLIFPHHENEIAQSECANGAHFANYWMHNGYINVDNKKMSKSLNNFFTTRDVAQKYGYEPIRLLMIQAHYRSQVNYTVEVLESCVASLERLYNFKENLAHSLSHAVSGEFKEEQKANLDSYKTSFIAAMEDDLNTADALSSIYELVREVNTNLSANVCHEYIEYASQIFSELTGVLGLLYSKKEEEIPQEILDLVQERIEARKAKDFAKADVVRDKIIELGYNVEETRQGTKITKKA